MNYPIQDRVTAGERWLIDKVNREAELLPDYERPLKHIPRAKKEWSLTTLTGFLTGLMP